MDGGCRDGYEVGVEEVRHATEVGKDESSDAVRLMGENEEG